MNTNILIASLSLVLTTQTVLAAVVVQEADIPGGDFSNDSVVPTDLTAEITDLPGGDRVLGTVGAMPGDILDEFSFSLTANGDVSIPYEITNFTGPANDSAFVVVGDSMGNLQTPIIPLNGNSVGMLAFSANTGGSFEDFVIRFDPPDDGSYSFVVGIPEPAHGGIVCIALIALALVSRRKTLTNARRAFSHPKTR